ncbi:MAG TPA: hypothetical protein V6C89_16710 [Drouetiella sp.]|jgi:hypothetical protein
MSTAELETRVNPEANNGSKPEHQEEQPPNCLAQADVKTPWLDINARFQLRSNFRNDRTLRQKSDKSTPLPFFGLPRFRPKKNPNGNSADGSGAGATTKKPSNSTSHDKTVVSSGDLSSEDASAGAGENSSDDASDNESDVKAQSTADGWHDLSVPAKRRIWQGWEGLAITTFGIALPTLVLGMSAMSMPKRMTLVMLNHPFETVAELLLLISVPIANYILWNAICNNHLRYSLKRGISMGAALMSCLIAAAVCIAGLFADNSSLIDDTGDSFSAGFIGLAMISLISGSVCAYLVNRIRLTRDFKNSRAQVLAFTAAGAILSLVTVIGAEFRPWSIRLAEKKAASELPVERQLGLTQLRNLEPERELLMECSDQRAAGLVGLFIPLKSSTQHELYFAITGKPYSFKDISNTDLSSMPDDYLSRHVVGERIPGLSMSRSYLSGLVHPNTLSSTIEWTYVFKNDSKNESQEARAEIGLPPGAVISGLKLWRQGEPSEAQFVASGKAEGSEGFTEVGHDSPAIVTDLGHGRALLHCYPIEQSEEMKLQVTMVIPLKADGEKSASLALPKFIATNFDLNGDHFLKFRSSNILTSTVKNLHSGPGTGGLKAISGTLLPQQLEKSNLILTAERSGKTSPIAVLDKIAIKLEQQEIKAKEAKARKRASKATQQEQVVVMIDGSKGIQTQFDNLRKVMALKNVSKGGRNQAGARKKIRTIKPKYVVEKVVQTAAPAPKELVIVVDGSATMKDHIKELTSSLKLLPEGIPAHVIVASQEHPELLNPKPLSEALGKLETMKFEGGQDNLEAVVRAAELAGETKGGAILWAHGPLPALNEEIYIMPSYVATPSFYELPLGSGETDTYDFFKNHSEIGPFLQVPRNTTDVVGDLGAFFSKWKVDQNGYAVNLAQMSARPEKSIDVSPDEQRELLLLHANQQVTDYLNTRHLTKAARIAVEYGLVSPVSCALIQSDSVDNVDSAENTDESTGSPDDSGSNEETASAGGDSASSADGTADSASSSEDGKSTVESSNKDDQGGDDNLTAQSEEENASHNKRHNSSNAPSLQGATNGTLGSDASYVTGVNTAGTVRVNNLANLEAMLNIFANLLEVGCGLVGLMIVFHSLANKNCAIEMMGQELEISQGQRIAVGIALLLFGLSFPGLLNWFVASARDANLFS